MLPLPELTGLILLILFPFLILFFAHQVREGRISASLRPIAAFDRIKLLMAHAIEQGKRLHLSLGSGSVTNATTAETLAGLTVLEHLSIQSAAAETSPVVTMADPATMLMAQNTLRKAYGGNLRGATEAAAHVQFFSPQPAAYAAGVMSALALDDVSGNVMLGHFGDEYLLMAESAHKQSPPLPTVAGAGSPQVLPYVLATSPQALWGEELFAAGAYLSKKPMHIGSLLAQDTVRWGVGLFILGSVALKAFGLW